MNEKTKLLAGCPMMVHGDTVMAKGIRFFMDRYADKRGFPRSDYNHTENLIWIDGIGLCTVGAEAGGVRLRPFEVAFPRARWGDLKIVRPKVPYTAEQYKRIHDTAIKYSLGYKVRRYQGFNFIAWPYYIATWKPDRQEGVWIGRETDKTMYCFETTARLQEKAFPYMFGAKHRIEITSVHQIEYNPIYVEWENWQALFD